MILRTMAACAAFALTAAQASAEDCQLKLLASLDAVINDQGVIVPVTLEGKTGNYMELALESIVSGLSQAKADELHLKRSVIPSNVFVNLEGQPIRFEVAPEIRMGNSTGDARVAMIPDFKRDDPRVVGELGIDILNRFDIELDLAHDKVNLFDRDHCPGQVIYWTRTAPVAVADMRSLGMQDYAVPMQLDGHDIYVQITTLPHAMLSSRIAQYEMGIDPAEKAHTFKMLAIDGLGIINPQLDIYRDDSGCNGNAHERAVPLRTEHNAEFERCYGSPQLVLGVPQLRHLRVFLSFKERRVYATAADAH